ncbi:hypothetical protein DAI22_12g044700 [Oryza sativa Japonica Group]|nr:hypothetical protein DAI22_12g044700 [Oryza sativa Japonica Group]
MEIVASVMESLLLGDPSMERLRLFMLGRGFFLFQTVLPTLSATPRCRQGEGANPTAAILLAGGRRPRARLLGCSRAQPAGAVWRPPLRCHRGDGVNLAATIRFGCRGIPARAKWLKAGRTTSLQPGSASEHVAASSAAAVETGLEFSKVDGEAHAPAPLCLARHQQLFCVHQARMR